MKKPSLMIVAGLGTALTAWAGRGGDAFAADLSSFPPPRTIQTRNNIGAVIYWDATPYIERFVSLNTPTKEALGDLEYEAVRLFVTQAPALARHERHLRIVVSFEKTDAISQRYQTKIVEGVETLLTVDGALHPGMKFAAGWDAAAHSGTFPRGIKVQIVSDLPSERQ